MRINAGELRHLITIQDEDLIADGHGGFTPRQAPGGDGTGWRLFSQDFASIQPLSGQEAVVARQLQSSITHKVVMRYRAGINAKQRILWEGRTFNIREVRNIDERNWRLELRVEEGVAT